MWEVEPCKRWFQCAVPERGYCSFHETLVRCQERIVALPSLCFLSHTWFLIRTFTIKCTFTMKMSSNMWCGQRATHKSWVDDVAIPWTLQYCQLKKLIFKWKTQSEAFYFSERKYTNSGTNDYWEEKLRLFHVENCNTRSIHMHAWKFFTNFTEMFNALDNACQQI